ncbi:NitT/TauT family transport system permease protein [Nocardia kruczakiae]|uniref:NitT/TauT family transport system permease protein n=1 Tax=Nocardia kruczakiae TaxID=261477 RepID=A0ABU1X7R9_9NOCA|nr:ABC transporter permease [Nocardia kruczakiae]MDR7166593.1 NitT/TauT family transport system permease protein [Nocardia kruczakiae]
MSTTLPATAEPVLVSKKSSVPAATAGGAPARSTPGTGRQLAALAGRWGWRLFKPVLVIGLFLAFWELAPRFGLVDQIFLPPFSTVVQRGDELIRNGQLWDNTSASLGRSLVGFAIAVACAVPAGVAIAWYKPVADFVNPLLELFRNTAALALLPVFILILGIGETSKVAIVVYAAFFPILLNTISGVRSVDPLLIKSAVSLGFSPLRLFQKVILPAAVPTIFTGIRMAASASILVLIATEMSGARAGLGYLITAAQQNFQIPDMYVGIVAIAIVGLVYNAVLVALERRLTRWRPQSDR